MVAMSKLKQLGVEMLPLHKLVAVTDKGIKVHVLEEGTDNYEEKELEYDTIILALGSRPQPDYIEAFEGLAKKRYVYMEIRQRLVQF